MFVPIPPSNTRKGTKDRAGLHLRVPRPEKLCPLVFTFERVAGVGGGTLHVSILFPSSVLLARDPSPAAEQLEYVHRAGREVVGADVSEETKTGHSLHRVKSKPTWRKSTPSS